MLWWERISPSEVGKGGFASIMRLSGFVSLSAGFLLLYSRSQNRFYGGPRQEGRAALRKEHAYGVYAGCGQSPEQILGCVAACYAVVQLC
jgi:hypothetical protein